jgi:hypothetical protein
MIAEPDCGDLGYDLGYLRHGSFGRATARWPGRLQRVAACAWAMGTALRWRASVRASYGLDAGAMVTRSTLALP